jgi:hypothetical protein
MFRLAACLVGGDGPMAAELGRLKGQMVAIEQASIQKEVWHSIPAGALPRRAEAEPCFPE